MAPEQPTQKPEQSQEGTPEEEQEQVANEPSSEEEQQHEEDNKRTEERRKQEASEAQSEEEFEKLAEELVSGQEIVSEAQASLSGDAKTACDYSVEQMDANSREKLGKNFFGWVKVAHEAYLEFKRDMEEKAGKKTEKEADSDETTPSNVAEVRKQVEERIQEHRDHAVRSMAGTVNRFLDDMNGVPPAETQVEKAWEEVRHKTEREFENNCDPEELAAVNIWAEGMYDQYNSSRLSGTVLKAISGWKTGRGTSIENEESISVEGEEKTTNEKISGLQEIQEMLDEKGVDLTEWLNDAYAENLVRDAALSQNYEDHHLQLFDGKTSIKDTAAVLEAAKNKTLTVHLNVKDNIEKQRIVQIMAASLDANLPPAIITKDGVGFESNLSLEQARRFTQLLSRSDVEIKGKKPEVGNLEA